MRSTFGRFACKEFSLYLKCLLASPSSVVTQQSLNTFASAFATPSVVRAGIFYTSFTLAVSLALRTDVVAEHGS